MTSRTDEIHKLIADIDNLLISGGKRLSRFLSSQAQEPREVLERIRNFLVHLGENEVREKDTQEQRWLKTRLSCGSLRVRRSLPAGGTPSPLLAKFVDQSHNQSSPQPNQPDQEQSNFFSQQLKSELSALIQPLQAEIAALLQERATLVQEIRQLEQKRLHNYSLSQQLANQEQIISDFLQALMNRLVPNLTPQMAENLANSSSSSSVNHRSIELEPSTNQSFSESSNQVERLTQLSQLLDQRLLSLDGTVNVVFEALQRNINTYHDSLSQGLARMHSTGVQGEQLMASLLSNLTVSLQPQPPSPQPSFLAVEKETLLPALLPTKATTISSRAVQPTHTSTEVGSQPLEFIESEAASAIIINHPKEDVAITDDLNAVLLQLGIDQPFSSAATATPIESQLGSLDLIGDEVDQLYASLFGTNNSTNAAVEINLEVVTEELLELNIAETTALTPISSETIENAAVVMSAEPEPVDLSNTNLEEIQDIPLQSANSSLESWQELFFQEDTDPSTPVDFSSLLTATENSQPQPTSADTIRALSELLADEVGEELLLQVDSPLVVVTAIETSVAQKTEVVINNDEEQLLDNYITASPQENLLSPEATQLANLPDISLNEEQWQQLNRDLANFDEHLHSQLPPAITNVQFAVFPHPETVENTSTIVFFYPETPQVPVSSPQTEADLQFSPTTEKKKELTTSGQDNPFVANGRSDREQTSQTPTKFPQSPLPLIPRGGTEFPNAESIWYLGIDLGTTGISAALLNRSTSVVHPIYWSTENQSGATCFQQSFRLPAEVYLPTVSVPQGETESTEATTTPKLRKNLYSAQLKPYLQVAIPYKNAQQKWEPVLQFNEFSAGPLIWVVRSLSKLLLTLKSDRHSTTQGLIASAIGINEQTFDQIINNIAGVICTCPSSWSEQYRFNVREALLTSKLVQHPQQVFFVEEAIASLLSVIDGTNGEIVQLSTHQGLRPVKASDHPQVGNTLVINIGATATEMALVDLPENLAQLTHNDFILHSFAYASKGIEQDIICQLLFPPKYRQSPLENQGDHKTINSNPWQWQPAVPGLDQMRWQSLGLEELNLPRSGEPDITVRVRLQQRLESSPLGQAVLDAALALKLILQHQESFTLELADQRWVLQRRDLESQVFVPFVRRLNRELNKLLVARGIPTEAINQAILTGGVASLEVVNRWLRQKLPNAKIIQDLELGENSAPNCSRVAYGLAMLPLHPQVLEEARQQYTDYFLFTELLRLLPDRNLSFGEVLQLFEGRGINTSICQQRLLAFLEGELPPGLLPSNLDAAWLTQASRENSGYQAIAAAPLFEKQGSLTYRPNSQQLLILRRYLDAIKSSTQQSLEEPYTVNFVLVKP